MRRNETRTKTTTTEHRAEYTREQLAKRLNLPVGAILTATMPVTRQDPGGQVIEGTSDQSFLGIVATWETVSKPKAPNA